MNQLMKDVNVKRPIRHDPRLERTRQRFKKSERIKRESKSKEK